jgi:ribosomal protein S18 acetylase RimI-like enzyme
MIHPSEAKALRARPIGVAAGPTIQDAAETAIAPMLIDEDMSPVFAAAGAGTGGPPAAPPSDTTFLVRFSVEFGERDAFVDELYVADAARGHGLGSAALQVAEEACREAGIHALHLEVEHANPRARALYERHGYIAHERRPFMQLADR